MTRSIDRSLLYLIPPHWIWNGCRLPEALIIQQFVERFRLHYKILPEVIFIVFPCSSSIFLDALLCSTIISVLLTWALTSTISCIVVQFLVLKTCHVSKCSFWSSIWPCLRRSTSSRRSAASVGPRILSHVHCCPFRPFIILNANVWFIFPCGWILLESIDGSFSAVAH